MTASLSGWSLEQSVEEAAHSLARHILISTSVVPRNANTAAHTNTGLSKACSQTSVLVTHKPMTSRDHTQASCCSHHSIKPWCDTVCPRPAPVPEDDPVVMVICQLLHSNPNHPASHGSNSHARNEKAWRDLEWKIDTWAPWQKIPVSNHFN